MSGSEQCSTCTLPQRSEVERDIRNGGQINEIAGRVGVSESALRRHRDNHMEDLPDLGAFLDLLKKSGIDIQDIARVDKLTLGSYQAITKDGDGEAEIHDLAKASIVFTPAWAEGPGWPVVQQAPMTPVVFKAPARGHSAASGWETAFIFPDIQAGFFRDNLDNLHPLHDEAAIDVALQVLAVSRPDRVVFVGDGADFAELSRFRSTPSFQRLIQATLNWVEGLLARVRAIVGPECEITWLAGNHEERLQNYILDNAMAAFGLRRANQPTSWPVLTFPYLCRFDDHNVTYVPGYPASEVWLNDRLRVIHGDKVSSNSTAHKYLDEDRVSTIFGHVHRREWAEKTRHTREGPRTILSMSPGCLSRIDGAVPSTKQGIDHDGIPLVRYENWQHGVAVVEYEPGDGRFVPEQVCIHQGWARWRGDDFYASVDSEGNALDG